MDGSFSTPSYNSIGDPYVDCKENTVHVIRGQRQFLSASSKKGQTGADWGTGPRKFVGLTGQYQEQYKEECTYRKENTSKNILPTGFRFSNPSKKSCSLGDNNGTFSPAGVKHMSDGKYKSGGMAVKYTESIKRNIITSPCKRGTYGYSGTLMGGKEIPYFKTGEEVVRKTQSGTQDKSAFKPVGVKTGCFDTHHHCDASKVYTRHGGGDDDVQDVRSPKERIESERTDQVSWKPSNSGQSGKTFDKFPNQVPEPYDERIVSHAMLPSRRNPVKDTCQHLPLVLRERKAFRPSNGPKSKLTKGTCLVGITKHSV